MKAGVSKYGEEFISCMAEVAGYVYARFGKFPGTFTTVVLTGFVQAVHLDTEFYNEHHDNGAESRHPCQTHGEVARPGRQALRNLGSSRNGAGPSAQVRPYEL